MPFLDKKGKTLNVVDMAKVIQTARNCLVNMRKLEEVSIKRESLRSPYRHGHYTKGEDNAPGNPVLLQKFHPCAAVKESLQQRFEIEVLRFRTLVYYMSTKQCFR